MPEVEFMVGGLSTRSQASFEVEKISGDGGPEYPRLRIPIKFTLRPHEDREQVSAFTLLWVQSSLHMANIKIGEGFSGPIAEYSWSSSHSRQITTEVHLDLYRLEKIEERRRGDIEFRLFASGLIVLHPPYPKADPNEGQRRTREVGTPATIDFSIPFSISQSHWVDKILPGLGYGKVKLIEVPVPERIVPESFQKALQELETSRGYFVEGDYDKVVAHCRNAVQLIPEVRPLDLSGAERPSFRDKVSRFLEQHLSTALADSKRKSLETMIKALWDLSSISHHPSPPGYFNRADAEVVMLVTTALLAYMGKMLKQEESKR